MHAIVAEDDNLAIFTDYDGRIIDCYEFQRLSFIDSLKTILRKAEKNEILRFTVENAYSGASRPVIPEQVDH